jgi:pimeloyl-ACP methyl ester carboxylesterase
MMKFSALILWLVVNSVWADTVRDSAVEFHSLFMQSLSESAQNDPASQYLHFVPDEGVMQAAQASTIEEAMSLIKRTNVDTLARANAAFLPTISQTLPIDAALEKTPLTMVIVPGIFGEFIAARPFESLFRNAGVYKAEYEAKVDAASEELKSDLSYDSGAIAEIPKSMKELVMATSLDKDGKALVKVVFLHPAYASLETLGDVNERARMLNRRLQKYLEITGPQNLVFVGYSRGTTFALEMLSQAKKEKLAWVGNVKGLIGLSGVVWGSTSADQTKNPNEPMYDTVNDTKELMNRLAPIPADADVWAKAKIAAADKLAMDRFSLKFLRRSWNRPHHFDITKMPEVLKDPLLVAALNIDFVGLNVFLFKAIFEIIRENPEGSTIQRLKNLVNAALLGADQLRTQERLKWWQSADLPDNVTYYSLTAIMPNAAESKVSAEMAKSDLAFTKGSFEDQFLIKGRNDYATASGIRANDSQVAIAQAMFLPNVIHATNPSLPPLKTQFLGTIGTHHWGAALEIVFGMKSGEKNPFPREALLKALAAKVALDQAN